MLMYEESKILIMLAITVITIIICSVYNWLKPKKDEEKINKISWKLILMGIFIIISSFIIVFYEIAEYKYSISIDPYFGNILICIKYIAYFVLMITVLCATFCYRKYKKVLPVWFKITYIIGIIFLIFLSVYIYLHIIQTMGDAVEMK